MSNLWQPCESTRHSYGRLGMMRNPVRSRYCSSSSHFGSSHFCSNLSLLARQEVVDLVVCLRSVMVRRGWTQVEVPDIWLQVIRRKRPPSMQWPRARSQQHIRQPGKIVPDAKKPPMMNKPPQPPSSRQSVPPEQLRAAAGCKDPEDPGIPRCSPARGHRREAGFVVRIGEGETTSASSSIGETDSCHGGVHCQGEEAPLASRCHHCRGQGSIAESRTRQRSRCARRRRRRRSFAEIKVATSRSANTNFATCGSCWGSGPSSANGRGIATSVAAPWCSCGPTGDSCGPVTNFTVPDSQEGGLRSSDGTRGVGVDGRPSRGHDRCTHGQEHNRSCAHLESDHGRNQEPPSRIGASVHGHQHGAVRGSKEARTTSTVCVAPGWVRLRIQVLPDCADSGEECRAMALLQLLSHQTRSHWFVPTRAGTCCPDSVQVPSQFRLLVQSFRGQVNLNLTLRVVPWPVPHSRCQFRTGSLFWIQESKCSGVECPMTQPWRSLWSHPDIGRPGGWS